MAAGTALAVALAGAPPSGLTPVAGVLGIWLMLGLALVSPGAAIALGFVLFGVVRVEPAPADAVLGLLAALAVVTGQVDLRHVPAPILTLLVILLALNVVSMTAAVELAPALRFFAITLYLVVLAVWLASHLRTPERMRVVIRAYVAGAAAASLLAVAALFIAYPGHELLAGVGETRAQGFFKDPNVFGPFLVPAALIALE